MITIIIFALIGALVGVLCVKDYLDDLLDYIMVVITALFGAVLGGAFGVLVAMCLPMQKTIKLEKTSILACLQDGNSVQGKFFLGSGQIEGKPAYTYYEEEKGIYTLHQIPADVVKIKYTSGFPKITTYRVEPTKAVINNFALDTDILDVSYLVEVPKGTIQQNYILDAK